MMFNKQVVRQGQRDFKKKPGQMATERNSTSRQGLDTKWDKKGDWCQSQTEKEMWEIVMIKENKKSTATREHFFL